MGEVCVRRGASSYPEESATADLAPRKQDRLLEHPSQRVSCDCGCCYHRMSPKRVSSAPAFKHTEYNVEMTSNVVTMKKRSFGSTGIWNDEEDDPEGFLCLWFRLLFSSISSSPRRFSSCSFGEVSLLFLSFFLKLINYLFICSTNNANIILSKNNPNNNIIFRLHNLINHIFIISYQ